MAETILGIITGLISIALYVYVSFAARRRGPILSNTYLFATKEERRKIDVKAEYRLVTVVFADLATVFAFLTLFIFTDWKWCFYVVIILIVAVIIYAIVESIRTERGHK